MTTKPLTDPGHDRLEDLPVPELVGEQLAYLRLRTDKAVKVLEDLAVVGRTHTEKLEGVEGGMRDVEELTKALQGLVNKMAPLLSSVAEIERGLHALVARAERLEHRIERIEKAATLEQGPHESALATILRAVQTTNERLNRLENGIGTTPRVRVLDRVRNALGALSGRPPTVTVPQSLHGHPGLSPGGLSAGLAGALAAEQGNF